MGNCGAKDQPQDPVIAAKNREIEKQIQQDRKVERQTY